MPDSPFLIFVVEDNEWYNKLLIHSLSLNPDYTVKGFFNAKDVINALNEKPSVITLDYRLPDMDGSQLLKIIKEHDPSIEVIVISEQDKIETALDLLKSGAYDYFVKSKDIKDHILTSVNHIRKNFDLQKKVVSLQKQVEGKFSFEKTIIGKSDSIKKVFELIHKAIGSNITVSITGETGTGKEVVAKAIHFNSSRKENAFVAINVAAIPSELIESELFGYEKGAFTGAIAQRKGKFEAADGGTLFLDEIGEMDINAQVKLLRALQEREITRVGSNETIKTNCRIIVATNKNLLDEVKAGNFREDLYYRLFGLPIHLPPLRERGDDSLILSQFFINNFCKDNDIQIKQMNEGARQKILNYSWPGNIRELKSVVELAVVMTNNDEIGAEDLTLSVGSDILPDLLTEELTLRECNIRIVKFYLKIHDNDTNIVAKKLGIGQTTVYRLLKEDSGNSEE